MDDWTLDQVESTWRGGKARDGGVAVASIAEARAILRNPGLRRKHLGI